MPEDFEPQEVTDAPDFDLVARNALLGLQASQTCNATAKGQRPLGNGGEKTGIAERDLDESQQKRLTFELLCSRLLRLARRYFSHISKPECGSAIFPKIAGPSA